MEDPADQRLPDVIVLILTLLMSLLITIIHTYWTTTPSYLISLLAIIICMIVGSMDITRGVKAMCISLFTMQVVATIQIIISSLIGLAMNLLSYITICVYMVLIFISSSSERGSLLALLLEQIMNICVRIFVFDADYV